MPAIAAERTELGLRAKSQQCTLESSVGKVPAMSRSCAKPTCSGPAVSWFDLRRASQEVIRSSVATDHGIALCASHSDRFSVPDGWTFAPGPQPEAVTTQPEAVTTQPEAVTTQPEAAPVAAASDANAVGLARVDSEESGSRDDDAKPENADSSSNRVHDRNNPWFVPSSAVIDGASNDGASRDGASEAVLGERPETPTAPREGSLLHRAFHGPQSDDANSTGADEGDRVDGRDRAPVDELSPRRRLRSSSDDAEEEATELFETFELPFPPHSPAGKPRSIAVS